MTILNIQKDGHEAVDEARKKVKVVPESKGLKREW